MSMCAKGNMGNASTCTAAPFEAGQLRGSCSSGQRGVKGGGGTRTEPTRAKKRETRAEEEAVVME